MLSSREGDFEREKRISVEIGERFGLRKEKDCMFRSIDLWVPIGQEREIREEETRTDERGKKNSWRRKRKPARVWGTYGQPKPSGGQVLAPKLRGLSCNGSFSRAKSRRISHPAPCGSSGTVHSAGEGGIRAQSPTGGSDSSWPNLPTRPSPKDSTVFECGPEVGGGSFCHLQPSNWKISCLRRAADVLPRIPWTASCFEEELKFSVSY